MATYGPGGRFAMTDRGRAALRQTDQTLTIGPSSFHWDGKALVIDLNEVSSLPLISRMKGRVTVTPSAITQVELPLSPDGEHVWRPLAPIARIKVSLDRPGWQFEGEGYLDSNFGTRPLERDFSFWTWARFGTKAGATCIYDAYRRDGSVLNAAIAFDPSGMARVVEGPPVTPLRKTLWSLRRETRADPGTMPRQVMPMLAPFYARALVETRIDGQVVRGVHEALDLDRFSKPVVKAMLAFRVPRRKGWLF